MIASDNLEVSRFVRFVSLDTHPAQNSLVVTYEILVSVLDRANERELMRRSKRDQLQINLPLIDQLKPDELCQPDRLASKLRQLSEQIHTRCSLLSNANQLQNLDDIQLHLLYLVNRRRVQLNSSSTVSTAHNETPNYRDGGAAAAGANDPYYRPPSSASIRQKQTTPRPGSRLSSRPSSSLLMKCPTSVMNSTQQAMQISTKAEDIYTNFRLKEEMESGGDHQLVVDRETFDDDDLFCHQTELYLDTCEQELDGFDANLHLEDANTISKQPPNCFDEAQLEGLYGDLRERQMSIAVIRRLINVPRNLLAMSSNRLFVCAILRVLRDSFESTKADCLVVLSILYCLIKLTRYEDTYTRAFEQDNQSSAIDLSRVVIDLFDQHVRGLTQADDLQVLRNRFYFTNCLLHILNNMSMYLAGNKQLRLKFMDQFNLSKLIEAITNLLIQLAKHLPRDIRQQVVASVNHHKYERLLVTSKKLISILWHVSPYKECINQLRSKSIVRPFMDSLINILNTLQLCRPASGTIQQANELNALRDPQTLNEIYQLELQLMKLIGNLICESRLRARAIRKTQTLKCVLRNLVLFLASRKLNTLKPFNKCSVLISPFKCLYELSCCDIIKQEIFKSKIIIKCLLEYLLSSASDLKADIGRAFHDNAAKQTNDSRRMDLMSNKLSIMTDPATEGEQILLDASDAGHYIVAAWLNLSAKNWAPIYSTSTTNDGQLDLIGEYLDQTIDNLAKFTQSISATGVYFHQLKTASSGRNQVLNIYIHLKLSRNLTQFLKISNHQDSMIWESFYFIWLDKLSTSASELVFIRQGGFEMLLTTECLAILTNLIESMQEFAQTNGSLNERDIEIDKQRLDSVFNLVENLARTNFGDTGQSDSDGLLLVANNLIGSLARNCEICPKISDKIYLRYLEMSNYIFETKTTDNELTMSCLITLSRLMNHSSFLKKLSTWLVDDDNDDGGNNQQTDEQQQHNHRHQLIVCQLLIERLASLLLHDDLMINQLANSLLNNVKQLEEQQTLAEPVAGEKRFTHLNSKWLRAIGAHQNNDDSPGSNSNQISGAVGGNQFGGTNEEDGGEELRLSVDDNGLLADDCDCDYDGENDDDDLNQLKTFESEIEAKRRQRLAPIDSTRFVVGASNDSKEEVDGQLIAIKPSNKLSVRRGEDGKRAEEAETGGDDNNDEDHDDDDDDDEDDDEDDAGSCGGPDLNVIDDNSMIRHLTNRREFRDYEATARR